ncbi:antitoxin Xre/MbcA/ParS toxin-binding domain-containing protein [Ostreiculturibacter nitratireducens]|uniref:antitoxin Xre/MbcA/ParS toxin-binding domain-containing protein n=1 Tax=Ostreiculturibacter nitratireducens TaxID=3075226 RepID=UPI0031B5C118
MSAYDSVPEVLGVTIDGRAPTPIELMRLIKEGLPRSALLSIAATIGASPAAIVAGREPGAARARRKSQATLTPAEGAVVARLAAVWPVALEIWGDGNEARAFLNRPHPLLEGRCPLDVILQGEIGRALVGEILERLRHGSAG